MSQTNNCALKKVVNSPAQWPATLNKPLASVTSYVFKSQENTQKFVKFLGEKLPGVEVKVNKDDKGMYIVNLTNLTARCKDGQNALNAGVTTTEAAADAALAGGIVYAL